MYRKVKRNAVSNERFNEAYINTDNIGIIKSVTALYSQSLSQDELIECGLDALWYCLINHDNNQSKFTSSLYKFMHWECLLRIRKKCQVKERKFISNVEDEVSRKEDSYDPFCIMDIMDDLERLEDEDRELFELRVFHNMTFGEIGERYGFTAMAAHSRYHRIVKQLRCM